MTSMSQTRRTAVDALVALLGETVSQSESVRDHHGHDESWHDTAAPDAVLFARSVDDVVAAHKTCCAYDVPIIPFGTGTSMEGNVNAVFGGVSIDTSDMQTIHEINQTDMDCLVDAGVTRLGLDAALRHSGLFFPVDPGADASLGGMAATGASGTQTVRYGSMRDNVLGLEVVLASGEIITAGGRARKSVSGYDLTRLFVGSEGTLGTITKVRLRLHPVPEEILAARCAFGSVDAAVDLACDVMAAGLPVARIELVDALSMQAINTWAQAHYPAAPTLFFEFHGGQGIPQAIAATIEELCHDAQALEFKTAQTAEDRSALWHARHNLAHTDGILRNGCITYVTDVVVPVSELPGLVRFADAYLAETHIPAPLCGHVGDGNLHYALLLEPGNTDERDFAEAFHGELVNRALSCGGTITGEHGVGIGKAKFLEKEHGPAVSVMKSIKDALDPKGIMNPGKIFPYAQYLSFYQ